MAAALGLSTYRWNNNLKSVLLLAAFPFLLLFLLGALFYIYTWGFLTDYRGVVRPDAYWSYGLYPVTSGNAPLDFTLAAIYPYWPFVLGVAAERPLLPFSFHTLRVPLPHRRHSAVPPR